MIRAAQGFSLLALTALVSCRSDARNQALDADLQRDLATAKARGLELASSAQGYRATQVVSAIEQVRPAQRDLKPRTMVRVDPIEPVPVEPALAPAPVLDMPPVVASSETPSEVPSEVPRVPSVAPRPAPVPVGGAGGVGSGAGADHDRGPDLGTIIGVVLRGGAVDPGHCVPRRRPPSQIPVRIPR